MSNKTTRIVCNLGGKARTFDLGRVSHLDFYFGGGLGVATDRPGVGVAAAFARFGRDEYLEKDVESVIALGLVGGERISLTKATMEATDAIRGAPRSATAIVAYQILSALFVGVSKQMEA